MGKKVKIGKQRKDKFYQLAKETGYRSRSAFKLLQLNRKFEFLQRSRILIDLCAAPGGWLQVALKCMPVSSLIIGIDLVPIKSLPNVTTHQEDITSDRCRHILKKELTTWKADVILNDGAPNVGKNWLHDAFAQAQLTLSALKLASEFLTRGGWFITKVFRSKDYHALLWVFKLLFKKVHATKPQASRHESAEIFVVCQNYIAPTKIDPKFFNPKYVFEEVNMEPDNSLNLLHPEKQKKKVEGYPEGDYTLHNKLNASEFIYSTDHIDLLGKCSEIIFDDDKIRDHILTTAEVKECCKDIKVLGKNDLRLILNWRKKLKQELQKERVEVFSNSNDAVVTTDEKDDTKSATDDDDDDDDDEILKETEKLKEQHALELKRKKKKVLKQKRKLQEKINLKMVIKNDEPLVQHDSDLFRLTGIKKKEDLEKLDEDDPAIMADDPDVEPATDSRKRKWISYSRDEKLHEWSDEETENIEETKQCSSSDEEEEDSVVEDNPLLVDLEDKKKSAVERWFEKDIFAGIENEDDDELELEMIPHTQGNQDDNKNGDASSVSDVSDEEQSLNTKETISLKSEAKKKKKKKRKLDPEGLALGTLMIQSKKMKRDIMDSGYNRYAFNDENLPDWFVKSEEKYYRKNIPVDQNLVAEYKARLKEINAKPIKKVIEAKSRKKKRAMRKLEKARKKAEALTDTIDMTDKEKAHHIRSIYKKALQKKDKNVTYIVAKKGAGKKVRRPYGVTGKFKVVDRRMKKDKRGLKSKKRK